MSSKNYHPHLRGTLFEMQRPTNQVNGHHSSNAMTKSLPGLVKTLQNLMAMCKPRAKGYKSLPQTEAAAAAAAVTGYHPMATVANDVYGEDDDDDDDDDDVAKATMTSFADMLAKAGELLNASQSYHGGPAPANAANAANEDVMVTTSAKRPGQPSGAPT